MQIEPYHYEKKQAALFIDKLLAGSPRYELPGSPDSIFCIPVSGGVDSTSMAILLHYMFPTIQFRMVFTDTMAEPAETYASLSRLEQYLGKTIDRIQPQHGLFELIDQYNGFLPSPSARYCTRALKADSFKSYINGFPDRHFVMFVGIRADESDRLAFTMDNCDTEMPFVDLGIRREDVFALMSMTIGIPRFYQYRTRSGCSTCFFQRRSELVGLYQWQPIEFSRGKVVETITASDAQRHVDAMPLWRDSNIAQNWLSLPEPRLDDFPKVVQKRSQNNGQLFGQRGLYIAGEFFYDGWGGEEFIWHQRIISYSTSLTGIKGQINDRFRHLLATAETFDMSPDDVRNKVRFAIWYIENDESTFDPSPPMKEGYTWTQGTSYAQLGHIISTAARVLQAEQLRLTASTDCDIDTVEHEWQQAAKVALDRLQHSVGHVVTSAWYRASDEQPEMTEEEMIKTIACPMCSI